MNNEKVKSTAYLIQKLEQKILYTGYLVWLEKKHHKLLTNLDLVITDGNFIRKGGLVMQSKENSQVYDHTRIHNLIRLFSKFTNNILFIHFGSWFYKNTKYSRSKL